MGWSRPGQSGHARATQLELSRNNTPNTERSLFTNVEQTSQIKKRQYIDRQNKAKSKDARGNALNKKENDVTIKLEQTNLTT